MPMGATMTEKTVATTIIVPLLPQRALSLAFQSKKVRRHQTLRRRMRRDFGLRRQAACVTMRSAVTSRPPRVGRAPKMKVEPARIAAANP